MVALAGVGSKLPNHLDLADDVLVEHGQVLRWNPVFRVKRTTNLLDAKTAEVVRLHLKLRDETCAARLYIPITCDLCGVVFVRDGIENRLIGQSRWKLTPT
jgi:hypothetical protein